MKNLLIISAFMAVAGLAQADQYANTQPEAARKIYSTYAEAYQNCPGISYGQAYVQSVVGHNSNGHFGVIGYICTEFSTGNGG